MLLLNFIIDRIFLCLNYLNLKISWESKSCPLNKITIHYEISVFKSIYLMIISGDFSDKKEREFLLYFSLVKYIYKFEFLIKKGERELIILIEKDNGKLDSCSYIYINYLSLADISYLIESLCFKIDNIKIKKIQIYTKSVSSKNT